MPDADEVQFQSPSTGAIQAVPPEHWDEALKQGYKPTTHKVMYSPEGQRGMVPNEQLAEKTRAGYQTTTKTQFEKNVTGTGSPTEGAGGAAWNTIKGLPSAIGSVVDPTQGAFGAALIKLGLMNEKEGTFRDKLNEIPAVQAAREVKAGWQREKGIDAPLEAGFSGLSSLVGVSGQRMAEHAAHGEGGKILGEAAVPAAMATLPLAEPLVKPLVKPIISAVPRAKSAIGLATRTEKGAVKPGIKALSRVVGGGVGGLAGGALGVPVEGSVIGGLVGPNLADAVLPARPFDIPTRGAELGATLPSIEEFYEQRGKDLTARGRAQEILDRKAAREAKANEPKILTPEAGPAAGPAIESEGRPATWTNEKVLELAAKGNRAAIAQAGVRQLELPPNARYVMGDIDYRNQITSPREVTRFTPEGQPIRQEVPAPMGENPSRLAQAMRVARPAAEVEPPSKLPQLPLNFEHAVPVPSENVPQGTLTQNVKPMTPVEGVLPGMAEHVARQAEGAAKVKGEELTAEMNRPRSVNEAAGEMERKGELFRGTAASPQGELLKPMEKPVVPEEEPQEIHIKGITAQEKPVAPKREAIKPIERRFSPEQITDAEGLIRQEIGMMQAADRPGVYYDLNEPGDVYNPRYAPKSGRMGGAWRGVKSGREMQPWMREHPEWGPAQLEKALRNKDSAMYRKVMESAIEFLQRGEEAGSATETGPEVAGEAEFPPREIPPIDYETSTEEGIPRVKFKKPLKP